MLGSAFEQDLTSKCRSQANVIGTYFILQPLSTNAKQNQETPQLPHLHVYFVKIIITSLADKNMRIVMNLVVRAQLKVKIKQGQCYGGS